MRLSIKINPEKEYIYWKMLELKSKFRVRCWTDLLEIMIDAVEVLDKDGSR